MQEITDSMLIFKEAVRHSWNTYFAHGLSPMSPDVQEAFGEIERGLFRGIVLTPLGVADRADEYRSKPLPWLLAQPQGDLSECPLQFGEVDANGNTRWGSPVQLPMTKLIAFEFFDFFDWDPYGVIDLPYVRARVRDLPSKADVPGSIVLIEQRNCEFLFTG